MAFSKFLSFSFLFFLALIITKINAEQLADFQTADSNDAKVSDSSIRLELDHLKSKISLLESSVNERIHELATKNEEINQLERIIEEKSTNLASLQKEIKSFQEKGSLDATQQIEIANTRSIELEKQKNKLKKEIQAQESKKEALETRINVAEKKIQDLNTKLESLQKINGEQKSRIRKTERALQAAEEEMMRAKMEATLLSKQLSEVHGGWLPPWLAVHFIHYQSVIMSNWKDHGKPCLDFTVQKALEKKVDLENWVHPHIETFTTKWIPIIKERTSKLASDIEPHMNSLSAKANHLYYSSKNAADPYYQEAKKFTKPYIEQAAILMKPHVTKAEIFLRPYTKKVVKTSRKYLKKAGVYHRQVQANIHETLQKQELTKSFATKEIAYYLATALMALPVILLFNLVSGCSRKKPKRRSRNSSSHTSHSKRRAKRVHIEK